MYDHDEELNLPTDKTRKDIPVYSGFIELYPLAIAAVARVMAKNQKKHGSKGWDRSKSPDHLNSMGRHLLDITKIDTDGESHLAHLACRAFMALQIAEEIRLQNERSVGRCAKDVPRGTKARVKSGAQKKNPPPRGKSTR